jgi:hypothetical protein
MRRLSLLLFPFLLCSLASAQQSSPDSSWQRVSDALGRKGQLQPDGAYKVGMPRKDLHVTLNGIDIKPTLALGAWVAFTDSGNGSQVMGDLVLTVDEVPKVSGSLLDSGVEISAIHNHLLGEQPQIVYMHIQGHGDAVALAKAVRSAVALTKTPGESPAVPASDIKDFNTAKLESILGYPGKNNGGVYQFAVPRAEKIMHRGKPVPNSAGMATAINFQPTATGKAAITGDFVLLGEEVNPVMKALRASGITVTALHSHMLDEEPRLFFMHFWANDDAMKLAQGLRAALDATNSAKPKASR